VITPRRLVVLLACRGERHWRVRLCSVYVTLRAHRGSHLSQAARRSLCHNPITPRECFAQLARPYGLGRAGFGAEFPEGPRNLAEPRSGRRVFGIVRAWLLSRCGPGRPSSQFAPGPVVAVGGCGGNFASGGMLLNGFYSNCYAAAIQDEVGGRRIPIFRAKQGYWPHVYSDGRSSPAWALVNGGRWAFRWVSIRRHSWSTPGALLDLAPRCYFFRQREWRRPAASRWKPDGSWDLKGGDGLIMGVATRFFRLAAATGTARRRLGNVFLNGALGPRGRLDTAAGWIAAGVWRPSGLPWSVTSATEGRPDATWGGTAFALAPRRPSFNKQRGTPRAALPIGIMTRSSAASNPTICLARRG